MKHIGIVARSAEGAALCYQTICREAIALVGKHDHPRITMDSIPMARWLPAFDAGDYAGVAQFMLESAKLLAKAGADFAICPDNSAHLAWEHVQAGTPIPWLHIAAVVGEEAHRRGFKRVGILGTRYTMGGPVYVKALGAVGIEAVVPEAADFLASELRPDDLVLVKGSHAYEHLARVALQFDRPVACRRLDCRRHIDCESCRLLGRPARPAPWRRAIDRGLRPTESG